MKLLKCKNCGGTDLRFFHEKTGLVKCSYCGSTYKLDSKGNIEKQIELDSIPNLLKIIIGLVCASILVGIINFFSHSSKKESSSVNSKSTIQTSNSYLMEEKEGEAKGEILELHEYTYGKAYYIGGFYKNTGTTVLAQPKIQVNFYNENDELVNSVTGYCYQPDLEPNEVTSFVLTANPKDKLLKKEIKHFPETAKYLTRRAKIEVVNPKLEVESWRSYVIGKVKNASPKKAKLISIHVVFLDKDKKILSQSFSYINEKFLNPSEVAIFKVETFINSRITDYWLETLGYEVDE